MSSKNSEGNKDYNTMIAHLPNARKAVIDVITQVPDRYDLKFPEGSIEAQVNSITGFIMNKFKTLTPNEILEAFEMNAAHQFAKHVEFYGKISIQTIGSLLYTYRQYKTNSTQRGMQEMENELNVEFELMSDIKNIKGSGSRWTMTKHIDEKYDWLCVNRAKEFEDKLDENEIKIFKMEYEEKMKDRPQLIPDKYMNLDIIAVQEIKMRRVRAYLEKLAPLIKM